ncbi:uncharacterized protein LOC143552911 [Bidens hawaiensis]|uniref:uncharacterized protein LOC143552911 n=1 Tax=Bidens hawaiensis TaxID=980011 RepID=UPI00404AAEEF
MGDSVPQPKGKEAGSTSVHCPLLTATNYTVWAMRMKIVLKVHKVWDTIGLDSAEDEKSNQETAKDLWAAIKSRHLGTDRVREARLQTLTTKFDNLKMRDSESIDDFAGKLSSLVLKYATLGEEIEETKMVKKFLKALPRSKYIQIIASLEQVLDLNKTGFEDVVGRFKAYEERIKEESMETQGNLLFSNGESYYSRRGENGSSGRGRGRNNRGRGRGRGNGLNRTEFCSKSKGKEKVKKDNSKLVCYRCDQMGNFASKCPDRVQKLQEANVAETVEADVGFITVTGSPGGSPGLARPQTARTGRVFRKQTIYQNQTAVCSRGGL